MAVFILLFPVFVFSQVKYSNEFLNLGVGARGLGMSNTQTAFVSDVTATYWNPAGLAMMEHPHDLLLMHAEYFAGMAAYDYAGYAHRLDERQSIGVNLLRFAVDDIPNTTMLIDNQGNIDYSRISYFTSADWALLLSYARMLAGDDAHTLAVGGNTKIIRRRIGDFAGAWGFGVDVGLQYRTGAWNFGAVARDVTTTFNAWSTHLGEAERAVFDSTGNELPENGWEYTRPHLATGAACRFNWKTNFTTLLSLDAELYFDGQRHALLSGKTLSVDPHFGMETSYKQLVFLRAGIGNFQQETDFDESTYVSCQINFGVGFCIKKQLFVDYALTDLGDVSVALYSHVFSLRWVF